MKSKFIVAIGSSAGGLSPMSSFFDFTPHDQATYIILRHIPFDVQSQLHHILQKHSKLKIVQAEHEMPIEKDFIYMPPASMYMTIKRDKLYLEKRQAQTMFPNRVIDVFLLSLAKTKRHMCAAVILSGTGNDGAAGADAVKKAGGMVVVQTPGSCEHTGMPEAVIELGIADHILLPQEMPSLIVKHINQVLKNANEANNLQNTGSRKNT